MWHSGTLAAAKQAVLLGLRGIALSVAITRDEPNFDILKPSVEKVLGLLLEDREFDLGQRKLSRCKAKGFPLDPAIGQALRRQSGAG